MEEEEGAASASATAGGADAPLPQRRRPRRYVIVGGGIAGVTAAEELLELADADAAGPGEGEGAAAPVEVTLLTATRAVKQVGRVVKVTRKLEEVDVVERDADDFALGRRNLRILQARATAVDAQAHVVHCQDGSTVPFDRCLVATGAAPKLVSAHPNVVGIRDTESVEELARRLASARRVLVVGNGGIALEVVHEVVGCELVWAVKDGYVGNTFFDSTASGFVLPQLQQRRPVHIVEGGGSGTTAGSSAPVAPSHLPQKRPRQAAASTVQGEGVQGGETGGALGPDWTHSLAQATAAAAKTGGPPASARPLTILFHAELEELVEPGASGAATAGDSTMEADWPLYVRLSNGETWGCDFVVSATGVVPVVGFLGPEYARGEDGGVVVNERMETTAGPDVLAAGDCCSMTWPDSDVWFQMRLWTQARTIARYAARCMAGQVDELGSGFAFELFAHMTRFFGFPVALLGCFNAQHLADAEQQRLVQEVRVVQTVSEGQGDNQAEETVRLEGPASGSPLDGAAGAGGGHGQPGKIDVLTRMTPGVEYLKVVVVDGRVKGAMLVGEGTEMAETFENLILNQIDVSPYGVDLLNPEIDIDDYFD